MPAHYWYQCRECSYRAFRYRNVKNCPDCGGRLVREESTQVGSTLVEVNHTPSVGECTNQGQDPPARP